LLPSFHWRWQLSAEDRFEQERAQRNNLTRAMASVPPAAIQVQPGDWPEFRGQERDSRVTGITIDTDWSAHPPKELWKRRVGPGWGSFAIVGDRLFTQEQRGGDEAVVCYSASTGDEIWEYRHPARFSEAMGGVGPRATPTIHDGFVYAQGATGKLVCLDAATGKQRWIADVTENPGGKVPPWGYSASPLVIDNVVVVYAGADGKGTTAFRRDNGELAWAAGNATHCYSSPHRVTLGGVEQVLMVSDRGIESFRPADGTLLWEYAWPLAKGMNRVTQPALVSDTDLVMTTGVGSDQGIHRVRVTKQGETWNVTPVWTSRALKPYYNDGVVYRGHLYGFDGPRLCCLDLATGKLAWKDEGTYGHGQVLLLADSGVLLVQAVDGKLALVEASPKDGPNELAKIDALKGKTWNHPAVAHGKLFVRNAEQAACFQLATK
jgi:outer membrane protein assembly factor BamB